MITVARQGPSVLLVEDEALMRKFLRDFLAGYGFRLFEAGTGQMALQTAQRIHPEVVILDLGLPDMDGQDVLRELREWSKTPILVLSIRDQDQQRIMALDNGADDYVTKPFSSGELLARVRAVLRRGANDQTLTDTPVFQVGHLKVDLAARRVFVKDAEVHFTPIEYKLLTTLIRHSDRVLTHDYLLKQVWGPKRAENTPHLRAFMVGLRRKIETDPARPRHLLTEQGVGYRLVSE